MENQESRTEIILGVDTHLEIHVGVVVDAAGRVQGTLSVKTHNDGYEQLLCWAQTFRMLRRAGAEGIGSYSAALTHVLQTKGIKVIEINRPDRSRRRRHGKSDATDAECAIRAILAGDTYPFPKHVTALLRRCVRWTVFVFQERPGVSDNSQHAMAYQMAYQ